MGWIEDRLRRPRHVSMWADLTRLRRRRSGVRASLATQPNYLEVWLEKDALSGIFEDVPGRYGVTLNVGRGYDGWASIHNAREAARRTDDTVLYFGDFDPSGEDMVRSLQSAWRSSSAPHRRQVRLHADDIERYNLPTGLRQDDRQPPQRSSLPSMGTCRWNWMRCRGRAATSALIARSKPEWT